MTETQVHQVLAVEKPIRTEAFQVSTAAYQAFQRGELFSGLSRTYTPRNEEGEQLPPEGKRHTYTAPELLTTVQKTMARLFDVTAQKDWANCTAKADVVVNGTVVLEQVPVTYLLFLEKQLTDMTTMLRAIPTLDPSKRWTLNPQTRLFEADPTSTFRTTKIRKNHVLYEATKEHPAQVETYNEDKIVGTWQALETSGALPQSQLERILERQRDLLEAVKFARELANTTLVPDVGVGAKIFGYLFG